LHARAIHQSINIERAESIVGHDTVGVHPSKDRPSAT